MLLPRRLGGLLMMSYCFLCFQELIGAPAGKLHTGRSRNDQVCDYISGSTVRTSRWSVLRLSCVFSRWLLTWGCGCAMPSRPWRTVPCSSYLPWWSGRRRERNARTGTRKHCFICSAALLKLSPAVLCCSCVNQGNRRPFSRLHPYAEGSANQVEPLDSKVILGRRNFQGLLKLDGVLFMWVFFFFFPSHAVALSRDVDRLLEIKRRVNILPLGRWTQPTVFIFMFLFLPLADAFIQSDLQMRI